MAIINTGPAIMSDWKERLAEAVGAGEVLEDSRRNIELFLGGTDDERAEDAVAELVADGEWQELNDRFYKTLAFGTGGLRGRTIGRVVTKAEEGAGGARGRPEFPCYGTAAMNFYNVSRAIRGFIAYVKKDLANTGKEHRPVFIIAQDTRQFSDDFARYCGRVCADLGCEAYLFDLTLLLLSSAQYGQGHLVPGLAHPDRIPQFLLAAHSLTIHLKNDVMLTQSHLRGRTVRGHIVQNRACLDTEVHLKRFINRLAQHPEPGSCRTPLLRKCTGLILLCRLGPHFAFSRPELLPFLRSIRPGLGSLLRFLFVK